MSQIRAEKFRQNIKSFDLNNSIQQIINVVNFRAEARSISVKKDFHPNFNIDDNDLLPDENAEIYISTDEERV